MQLRNSWDLRCRGICQRTCRHCALKTRYCFEQKLRKSLSGLFRHNQETYWHVDDKKEIGPRILHWSLAICGRCLADVWQRVALQQEDIKSSQVLHKGPYLFVLFCPLHRIVKWCGWSKHWGVDVCCSWQKCLKGRLMESCGLWDTAVVENTCFIHKFSAALENSFVQFQEMLLTTATKTGSYWLVVKNQRLNLSQCIYCVSEKVEQGVNVWKDAHVRCWRHIGLHFVITVCL